MKKNLIPILFLFIIFGCIEEYTPKGVENLDNILVVEGSITNGESVFTLRRSIGIDDDFTGREFVSDAQIYVESNKGNKITGYYKEKGEYIISTGILDKDTEYRIRIIIEGEEYESKFLSPLFTPEIDSIGYYKSGQGKPVFINVSTHDPQNQSPFYMWSFEENWEVKTELFIHGFSNGLQYCWGKDFSNKMLLGSSKTLSQNIINRQQIAEIPCDNDRLSLLYHITVTQKQIRKEAHEYFTVLKNNVEKTGGLFAPILTQMKGNISCISNRDIPVIGYIEVSTTTSKGDFFPKELGLYEAPRTNCVEMYGEYGIEQTPPRCYLCTYKENATKRKPEWWPTENF